MPFYRFPNGQIVHMRGTRLPAPCSARVQIDGKEVNCLAISGFLCDGPPPSGRASNRKGTGTCDRPMCAAHAHQVAPNRHLCPACFRSKADAQGQRSLFTSLVQP